MSSVAVNSNDLGTKYVDYVPFGNIRELFRNRRREVILDGPAGTGKSRGCLEKLNFASEKYTKARCVMARKTRKSLTQSGMITFEQRVLASTDYAPFHGGDQEYKYPNGSVIAVVGLDDPRKLYSSDWDIVYVQQAEELDEDDWQSILRSLRNWKLPYQQIIGDCNPDSPGHWIKAREASGALALLPTKHEDNPELYDAKKKDWTERGRAYLSTLDALVGVRYKRLRLGLWVAAEGTVYEEVWDRSKHLIPRFVNAPLDQDQVPVDWPRYWVVDFGYTNPFVWQAWAVDPDGRLFRYKEIYKTKTLVEDHAKRIKEVTQNDPPPRAIICDHDAEDRATLERHLGLKTVAAFKAVSAGIDAVATRLKDSGDGKPRLFYLRDSLIDLDQELLAKHVPTATEYEYEVYVWDTANNRRKGEQPVKAFDHGMDDTRYLVAHVDQIHKGVLSKVFAPPVNTRSGRENDDADSLLVRPSPWRI